MTAPSSSGPAAAKAALSAAIQAPAPPDAALRRAARLALGASLLFAGIGHLTFAREEFPAQVPSWFPVDDDVTVVVSGVAEIALGSALIALPRYRVALGLIAAAFFVVVFPGNLAQWWEHQDGFGLDTDGKRFARLFFQPVLIAWALWSTGAAQAWRRRR